MKRISSIVMTFVLFAYVFCFASSSTALAGEIVEPSVAKILVNGSLQTFDVYNINQTNYFKLRDLAFALQGTSKEFDVGYDVSSHAIIIEKNKAYTGGNRESSSGKGRIKIAEYSKSLLLVDGKLASCLALDIEQDTYFSLRGLMQALEIPVVWDAQTQTVSVDTNQPYVASVSLPLSGRLICLDPGHGTFAQSIQEPIAPNSKQRKPGFVSGTAGEQYSEAQVNLAVGLMLKEKLEAQGAQVLMTREGPEAVLSNVGRAKLANNAKADMVIRIHCDGSNSSSHAGMSMLVPSNKYMKAEIANISYDMGTVVLNSTLNETGAVNRGIVVREDLTGFNWSTVPTILIEMGFMSNSAEDGKLSTVEYQGKLATGISTGIMTYFQEKETVAPRQKLEKNNSPIAVRVNNYMKKYPGMGQQEALWKIKLNLDKPEFVQAKVLTKEELASSIVIVNKRYRVPDDYKPNDLVSLTGRVSLRAEAKTAFDQMTAAAKSQGYRITPVSGYRSVAYQHCLYQCYLRSDSRYIVDTYSARAGFSEHHTGMAIDVAGSNGSMSNFGATKEFAWVKENASRYGFIIRYLPDTQYITGYKNEPWHLRYVGTAVAEEMKAQRIKTLEEYVGKFLW